MSDYVQPRYNQPGGIVLESDIAKLETQPWQMNSVALKFLRDENENPRGTPLKPFIDLFLDDREILTLKRDTGEDYWFELPLVAWSWKKMIRTMKPEYRDRLCGQAGIVGVWLASLPNSYDVKRENAARKNGQPFPQGAPVPVWDFFVLNGDGMMFRFHPNLTNNKISLSELGPLKDQYATDPPKAGRGRSDGRGTFQRNLKLTYKEQFVAVEAKAKAKAKASAKAEAIPPPPPPPAVAGKTKIPPPPNRAPPPPLDSIPEVPENETPMSETPMPASASVAVGGARGQSYYSQGGELPPSQRIEAWDPRAAALEAQAPGIATEGVEKTQEEAGEYQPGLSSNAPRKSWMTQAWAGAAAEDKKKAESEAAEAQNKQDAAEGEEEKKKEEEDENMGWGESSWNQEHWNNKWDSKAAWDWNRGSKKAWDWKEAWGWNNEWQDSQ